MQFETARQGPLRVRASSSSRPAVKTPPPTKKVVVALGGNALLERKEEPSAENQARHARQAAEAIGRLVRGEGWALCVTHGNGPQIGLLALQMPEAGLDVLGAESEGQIGYLLESELGDELGGDQVVSLLTQTTVSPDDPAFKDPSKFIGPTYSKDEAERNAREKGWTVKADGKKGYRRVVASPAPLQVLEARAIQVLLDAGFVTVCAGGGGVPVAVEEVAGGRVLRRRHGIEAVIDKDAASALLAAEVGAEALLLLTDAPAVFDPRKWPDKQAPVPSPISPEALLELGDFSAGSMGPKVQAACKFVRDTGGIAGIGALGDALDILRGTRGTLIKRSQP
ncbi:hypothetical protein WJX81_000129 [Elliptochloris bilobata]|uniref:Carbamate kinase n=1 Tax=Elliptochloris bilobata TaxID=381761 RepID=A0AAW1RMD6_9CHLO